MVQISYVRFKKRLLTFAKFVEIVERSRLKRVFLFSTLKIRLSYALILTNPSLYIVGDVIPT